MFRKLLGELSDYAYVGDGAIVEDEHLERPTKSPTRGKSFARFSTDVLATETGHGFDGFLRDLRENVRGRLRNVYGDDGRADKFRISKIDQLSKRHLT